MFFESTLVGAALRGVLAVYEAVVFLAILRRVGKGNLYVLALDMHDGIKGLRRHIVVEQVLQSVARKDATAVVEDGKARVQIGIVAQQRIYELVVETKVGEEFHIGFEIDISTVFLSGIARFAAYQLAALKPGLGIFPLPKAAHQKERAERVYRFQTDAVQAHAGREDRGVVFCARVQFRHCIDYRAKGYSAAVVAYACRLVVLYFHFDALSETFVELVYAVVDGFFQ